MKLVEVELKGPPKNIDDYKDLTPEICLSVSEEARTLAGKTVAHINATSIGGGVAELLTSQVPLERSLGIDSHWLAIEDAPPEFFAATKNAHNLLQGKAGLFTEEERSVYLDVNKSLGKAIQAFCSSIKGEGVVVVHDAQPMGIIHLVPKELTPLLRIHMDLLTPNTDILNFLKPYISEYPKVILSSEDYQKSLPWLEVSKSEIIPPAIDPFTEKNLPMELTIAKEILTKFNINPTRPIVTQVSRFDPWKDPLGVIRAYSIAKNEIPELQLVLAGFILAKDDPEAESILDEVKQYAKEDHDIHIFSDPEVLGDFTNDTFINALYTASTIMVQKSIREGFGLTMTEAMWKGDPLVAGATTGALMQVKDGENGLIVVSPEEAGEAIVRLMKDGDLRERLGKAAHESVRENFLFSRFLLDNLRVYNSIVR